MKCLRLVTRAAAEWHRGNQGSANQKEKPAPERSRRELQNQACIEPWFNRCVIRGCHVGEMIKHERDGRAGDELRRKDCVGAAGRCNRGTKAKARLPAKMIRGGRASHSRMSPKDRARPWCLLGTGLSLARNTARGKSSAIGSQTRLNLSSNPQARFV